MTTEHVTTPSTDPAGGGAPDDASAKLAELEAQVQQLLQDKARRDEALTKMQSEKDKVQAKLDREQKERARLEAARVKDVSRLQTTEQTAYLQQVAASEHQRATRFELAHKYNLDPTELEGEFESPEAMRLRAIELAQQREAKSLEERFDKLTELVTQMATLQQAQQAAPPGGEEVTPDVGGRRGQQLPDAAALDAFDKAAEEYRKRGRHDLATQAVLNRIYRDPSKIMGSATPSEPLPPEALQKVRR